MDVLQVMGEEYISHRPQMVDLTCKLGMQLELKDVTVHDAVLLMDRVMSTGAKVLSSRFMGCAGLNYYLAGDFLAPQT